MKRKFFLAVTIMMAVALTGASLAWQTHPNTQTPKTIKDTIPQKQKKIVNVDDALEELERASAEVEKAEREIDMEKMKAEVKQAMEQAQKEMAKAQAELKQSMKEFDGEKLKMELQKELQKIDAAKIKAEVEASLAQVDFKKMQKELEKFQEVDLAKMRKELEEMQPRIERSMKEAREGIQKAKAEMLAYKDFINELHDQRLINKNEPYKVEWQKGVLTINGKQQSEETARKFSFLKERKDFILMKDADGFSIDVD